MGFVICCKTRRSRVRRRTGFPTSYGAALTPEVNIIILVAGEPNMAERPQRTVGGRCCRGCRRRCCCRCCRCCRCRCCCCCRCRCPCCCCCAFFSSQLG